MADVNLNDVLELLLTVAHEAGEMMLAANLNEIAQDTKLNSADIVTEVDKAVEAHVSTRLTGAYPSFDFLGEETYRPGQRISASVPTFVVDPIDGTTNFVHGFPWACVSLALVVAGRPAVGVVYSPFLGLEYSGVRGGGSFVRDTRLPDSPKRRLPLRGVPTPPPLEGLSSALVVTEWGSERSGANFETRVATFRRLGEARENGGAMVHSMRCLGSAALNVCSVAAGQTDLYWEGGCWAWDVAAAWVVLEEAGGRMVGGNPGVWEPKVEDRAYLAVRGTRAPKEQTDIIEELWKCMGDNRLDYSV